MKNKMIWTNVIWAVVLLVVLGFEAGSWLKQWNAKHILDDPLLQQQLGGVQIEQVENVEYLGKGGYRLQAGAKEMIAVQTYTSVMNYRWDVYE
ncbi:hypothetical protein CIG75_17445 [Tumebacillus algifaecis]|uniref:DUF3139 domain-containing protein n=1 Tax=Tumebacillus algifaecis TaxID=1214604 RepID=A0A223D4S2_9BACL|nr:hypothetical protein [Tumebacillus algifaecis]ASS76571.1 hypothetical protein CIG75_17445 [Tumebacillus algifaecis]